MDNKEALLTKANDEKKAMCVNYCQECDDKTLPCAINTSCANFSIERRD